MPKTVTITFFGHDEDPLGFGGFDVTEGELSAGGGLTLGEMLEQVLGLFKPTLRTYPIATRAELMARRYVDYADFDCACDDWSGPGPFEFDPIPF